MAVTLGSVTFDTDHTTIEERLEEVGGRDERKVTISGLIIGEPDTPSIEAKLDAIIDAASAQDYSAELSLRSGRRLFVRRDRFDRTMEGERLVGSFALSLLAKDPVEESTSETNVVWNVAASDATQVITPDGNAEVRPKFSLVNTGTVVNPRITDGTRSISYEGPIGNGETLVFDGTAGIATLEGVDVTPYTSGEFPRATPESTTFTYEFGAASGHSGGRHHRLPRSLVVGMNYLIEVFDTAGRRIAWFDDVPIIEATRRRIDDKDEVRGILPIDIPGLGVGYRVRVTVDGDLFADCEVTETAPEWSDARKLILERYVNFHEVAGFEAERESLENNGNFKRAYQNRSVGEIVKDAIQSALGEAHYTIDHSAYPEGAQHEYAKFLARKTGDNELEVGGIDEGQWVGGARIDITGASAKDGDTIQGLKVDGEDWPDLRLMLIDCEETSLNSHAESRHPEVADWTADQYNASGYKASADAATDFLQNLIDTHGIDYIELNPHRDASGNFDDRVDAFGRYLGLVYGGGECYNAGLVEEGRADVFLFDDGAFHEPSLQLKDFFSYAGVHTNSIENASQTITSLDVDSGIFEALTALAYAAGGYTFDVDPTGAVRFREAVRADHTIFFDPTQHAIEWGFKRDGLGNYVVVSGNPTAGDFSEGYAREESIDTYDLAVKFLDYFSISLEEDADTIAEGVLDDLAYPEPRGEITFYHGNSSVRVGDLIEVRGAPIRRYSAALGEEWSARFTGQLIARVREVRHRFTGRRTETRIRLSSPLRSVENPLSLITKSQPPSKNLFQFRLDDEGVGLDLGYHLD